MYYIFIPQSQKNKNLLTQRNKVLEKKKKSKRKNRKEGERGNLRHKKRERKENAGRTKETKIMTKMDVLLFSFTCWVFVCFGFRVLNSLN